MTTTHSSLSVNASSDTAIAGTSLNALANGSYAMGAAINNTPADGTTIGYPLGDLLIGLSSAVTTGAGAPNITVFILPALDGTNYPTPPGASAGAAPLYLSYTFQVPASTSTQFIACPDLPLPPCNFKVQIQNNLGVALPATNTSTATMFRKTLASW